MASQDDWTIATRATLLARLKDIDDHKSWGEFVDTYSPLIRGVAVKWGLTKTEAKDVVQETMISVARHMPGFKYDAKIGSFKSWLLKMTRWRISDQFKKRQRSIIGHEGYGEMVEGNARIDLEGVQWKSDLEKLWDEEWKNNLLNAALGKVRRRLNPRHYQAYDCCVNKGWKPERVAKLLGIPVDQVYLAKHRVLEAVKKEVQRLQHEII